jgi:hypothetical protein
VTGAQLSSDLSATVDWGDGSLSVGTVDGSSYPFTVTGSHTYSSVGTFPLTVTVTDNTTDQTSTASATATVSDSLSVTGQNVSATEGRAFSGTVATGTERGVSSLTAVIDWGDHSTPTTGVVSGGGVFHVTGSHTYAEERSSYTVTVTFTDDQGDTLQTNSTATVADAALHFTSVSTKALSNHVERLTAVFTDADHLGQSSDYTVTVDWGDKSSSTLLAVKKSGSFTLVGQHTYAPGTTYKVVLTVTDSGGSTVTQTVYVTVS